MDDTNAEAVDGDAPTFSELLEIRDDLNGIESQLNGIEQQWASLRDGLQDQADKAWENDSIEKAEAIGDTASRIDDLVQRLKVDNE